MAKIAIEVHSVGELLTDVVQKHLAQSHPYATLDRIISGFCKAREKLIGQELLQEDVILLDFMISDLKAVQLAHKPK